MAHCKTDVSTFRGIKEVCELYDLTLLTDLAGELDGGFHIVYYIGQQRELAAGLRGFEMTPCFDDLGALELFCQRHIERFRQESEYAVYPEATSWETVSL